MDTNFVYLLICALCLDEYTGESGRLFRSRMREHYLSVIHGKSDNAMGAHYLQCHSDRLSDLPELPFTCRLIRKCKDFVDRKLWQSIDIKHRQPAINKQLGETREHNLDWKI